MRRDFIDPIYRLTPKERHCIEDTDFFETKRVITQKTKRFLQALHEDLKKEIASDRLLSPEEFDSESNQFVKGEHLLDFPYQYLDYPKFFSHTKKFTFRTLFWWGHFLVSAWILEGTLLQHYKQNLLEHYEQLADNGLFILLTETPWEWRKGSEYLIEIRRENKQEVGSALEKRPFLKVQRFIEFDHPVLLEGDLKTPALESYRLMLPIVSNDRRA